MLHYYFQFWNEVKMEMNVESAYHGSIKTLFDWISSAVNTIITQVIFRTVCYCPFQGPMAHVHVNPSTIASVTTTRTCSYSGSVDIKEEKIKPNCCRQPLAAMINLVIDTRPSTSASLRDHLALAPKPIDGFVVLQVTKPSHPLKSLSSIILKPNKSKAMARIRSVEMKKKNAPKVSKSVAFASALIALNTTIVSLIIAFVPYTKIDWDAYMLQVDGFLGGESDFNELKEETGPSVYPAGFFMFTL